MFYPWNLDEQTGSLALLLSYSRALKAAGYRMDCFAPRGATQSDSGGLCHGVFDNVFVEPNPESPLIAPLGSAGELARDSLLPDKLGRNTASMAAAAVLAAISNYDVVGIHYTRCHSLIKLLPDRMPVVMFTHDLDSLVSRQEQIILGGPAKYQLSDEAMRLEPFNLVTVVGSDDERLLHTVEPGLPIVQAPFTTTIEEHVKVAENSDGKLLWISSAASFHRLSFLWFWNEVWPQIRLACPQCRLTIAGRISDIAKESGASNDPMVSLLGVVDDANRLYDEADVLLAPYYFGLGIKTKIIEALGRGIPVVTTTLGVYNTRLRPDDDVLVSNDASQYASQVIRLISDPGLRSQLIHNGREYVRKYHDPETALRPLVEAFGALSPRKKQSSKLSAGTPQEFTEPLRYLVPWVVQRCQEDGVKRVAIYGAGSHTRMLIPMWKALGGPEIREVVVSGEPLESTFMNLPVVSAERFNPGGEDAIVLSSYGYEQEMASTCKQRWPEVKIYPIWRPLALPTAAEKHFQSTIPTRLYDFTHENTTSLPV